jgi:hypothetical protein
MFPVACTMLEALAATMILAQQQLQGYIQVLSPSQGGRSCVGMRLAQAEAKVHISAQAVHNP